MRALSRWRRSTQVESPDEDSDDDWGGRPAELATSMSPGILDCLWPNVQPVTEKFYALLKARDVTCLMRLLVVQNYYIQKRNRGREERSRRRK